MSIIKWIGGDMDYFITPFFSKKYSLNLDGLDKFVSTEEKLKAISLWAYKLGLMLDDYIPLQGFSNFERIELALNEYVKLKKGG